MTEISLTSDVAEDPQNKVSEFADYNTSRMMALNARPVTTQARSLVIEVVDRLLRWEEEQKSRRYRRGPEKLVAFRRSVGYVLGDLLLAADRDPDRWSYRPMSKESFNQEPVSYRQFQSIFN